MSEDGDQSTMIRTLASALGWIFLAVSTMNVSYAMDTAEQLNQASECRNITPRLERLACFDHIFQTPLAAPSEHEKEQYPPSWNRAMRPENFVDKNWIVVTEGEGKGSNAWIALTALNSKTKFGQNAKPVLMMSCIDNLSRVELALPNSVEDARVQISIRNRQPQLWRSDNTGVLMSSARGIPAIEMMKAMANEPHLVLRSNAAFVDGLMFETRDLHNALAALRERCGW